MSDWTSGYVADIGYTFGYYTELNPLRVKLAFLHAGLVPPEMGAACELGFGQGMSANLHAAASVVQWHGTDFNPSQAAFAQELASAAGCGAQLFDEAFDQFCTRADLPEFDYIGLHGIWSWISDENRKTIVDFIRRKLKVGGVLYISYNTQPGWAAMVPMRDLLTEHAEVLGSDGAGIVSRIDSAVGFVDQLLAANPTYARANPQVAERIKKIKEQDRHYVAHEYFNRDWQPMAFAQMARWLEPAKLSWACSANNLDAIDLVNLTAEQLTVLPLRTSIDLVASLIAIPLLAANLTSKPSATDSFFGRMSFPLYLWHWIPHTALVLGILKTGSAHWVNIAVALLVSLAGGYALTWIDIRTDLIRSKAISGLNRALNKHQKPN